MNMRLEKQEVQLDKYAMHLHFPYFTRIYNALTYFYGLFLSDLKLQYL